MAEWSKAAVLKTVEVHASVGSNPTPSANKNCCAIFMLFLLWLRDPNSDIRFDGEVFFQSATWLPNESGCQIKAFVKPSKNNSGDF
jgi:hypothetical protein